MKLILRYMVLVFFVGLCAGNAANSGQKDHGEILNRLRKQAKGGSARAQEELGSVYFYGKLSQKPDASLAVHWYQKAAKAGRALAQFNLGICYDRGSGVKKNREAAVANYKLAADQGVLPAIVNVAFALKDKGEMKAAAGYFALGANKGNRHCQREYGMILITDLLGEPDPLMARQYLERAVDTGDRLAALPLANLYAGTTEGIPADPQKTFDLLLTASEADIPEALSKVAFCYEEGIGVKRSTAQAVSWYTRAAKRGYTVAMINLADCLRDGRGTPQDLKKAFEWYGLASENGHVLGTFNLAVCYTLGIGVDKSDVQALALFRKAAEADHAGAQFNLGVFLQEGRAAAKDLVGAAHWFKKAADAGNPDAMIALSECYGKGLGIAVDIDAEVLWRRKALAAKKKQ